MSSSFPLVTLAHRLMYLDWSLVQLLPSFVEIGTEIESKHYCRCIDTPTHVQIISNVQEILNGCLVNVSDTRREPNTWRRPTI